MPAPLAAWAIPIFEAVAERLIERLARGDQVEAIKLGELLDEADKNALRRAAALQAARMRIEARERGEKP